MNITERYGCTLRIYDNGGKSTDRFTCIPPRWARDHIDRGARAWECIAASKTPYHPQSIGLVTYAVPGKHLGKRLHWDELPEQVQRFARDIFPEYCPQAR